MSINVTPLSKADFDLQLKNLLKVLEGNEPAPYYCTSLKPTVGIGFNMSLPGTSVYVYDAMHILQKKREALDAIFTDPSNTADVYPGLTDQQKRVKYAEKLQTRLTAALGYAFSMSEAQIAEAYTNIIQKYVDAAKTKTGLDYSLELIAFTSMQFNVSTLIGPGLKSALAISDPAEARAEAWWEIRYNHANQLHMRRYVEAAVFGLYDRNTGWPVTQGEALAIYRMYTRRGKESIDSAADMVAYDKEYFEKNRQNAQDNLNAAGFDHYLVKTLKDELKNAADVLIAEYVKPEYGLPAFNPLNIQVGSDYVPKVTGEDTTDRTGSDADLLIGRDGRNDYLIGNGGNDLLIGQAGDDFLVGGKGDDVLIGGKGFDTYIWSPGDGNDRIIEEDEDGNPSGMIIIKKGGAYSLAAAGLFKKLDGQPNVWEKEMDDGSIIKITRNSPWKLVTEDGGELLLGDGFQDGDFGIKLIDTPEESPNPNTDGITVHGDLKNMKFYDSENNVYYKKDDYGNYITTNESSPDKWDELFGSSGNDHLFGYGGNDHLRGKDGDDIVEGGTGDDWLIDGAGDDVLIGGTGSDALFGGQGNDRLFAEGELDPDAVLEAGETGIGTGAKGDVLSGHDGLDQLYGDAGNDILFGGAGSDIVYGGAGNDLLEGDTTVSGHSLGGYPVVAVNTWFGSQISDVYTFNAPGLGGLDGNIFDVFRAAFGLSDTAIIDGITNVRETVGIPLISYLATSYTNHNERRIAA